MDGGNDLAQRRSPQWADNALLLSLAVPSTSGHLLGKVQARSTFEGLKLCLELALCDSVE